MTAVTWLRDTIYIVQCLYVCGGALRLSFVVYVSHITMNAIYVRKQCIADVGVHIRHSVAV
jgi:hypothetical protein